MNNKPEKFKCPYCEGSLVLRKGHLVPDKETNDSDAELQKDPLIAWDDRFNTNIGEVDEQHQIIVEMINKINRSLRTDIREEGFIKGILQELKNYIIFHFDLEEKMFEVTEYPEIEFHKKWHISFVKKVRDLADSYEDNVINLRHVLKFLVDWFIEHITRTDRTYVPYVKRYRQEQKK